MHNMPSGRFIPVQYRRWLRRQATPAERRLWACLRRRQLEGRRFRRQHSIGPYVVDFYCSSERLVIELDGAVHADPARAAYDARREAFLKAQGIRVLRFENRQVMEQLDVVLETIRQAFRR